MARLLDGADADLVDVLTRIIGDQHVPYLAQLRYTATGMRNRAQWEKTWAKQREEDSKGIQLKIDVPPKYKKEDFLKGSYWSQRGKLDVPKERFISYPLASPNGDDSLLLGRMGSPGAGARAHDADRGPFRQRRVGRGETDAADRRAGRGDALGGAVACGDRS
jgi:hypothetical protein